MKFTFILTSYRIELSHLPSINAMNAQRTFLHSASVLIAMFATLQSGVADEEYPQKPLKVVVPFSPGGGSDTFVRIVQKVIQEEGLLPQPLVVINVPGAGGTIGSRRVRDGQADGYTILNLHDGILSAKLANQVDYGPEAFQAIAATGRTSSMVCVRADSEFDGLTQLLESAATEPNTVKFGANLGALSHFDALRMEQAHGTATFRYVPTGGGAKRFGDLIGGHVDVTVFNIAEYDQFKDGGVKAIAVFAKQRHPDFPSVPTATESGINVVRDSMQYWWAPVGTPPERVTRLVKLFRDAMNTSALKQKLAELKMDPVFLSGRELQRFLVKQELAMGGVGTAKPIQLPNTPLFMIVIVGLLGMAALMQGLRRDPTVAAIPSVASQTNVGRSAATLGMLLVFGYLFSISLAPFWVLSSAFILLLGGCLLDFNRRNSAVLIATAVIVGPGCYLLFTKILTIDLP